MTLSQILSELDSSQQKFIDIGKKTAETHALYTYDLFISAILNRSLNLVRGFCSLVRDNNFIAAAPIVRIHLDSLLRLYASRLVDYNIDEFAKKVISGKQIRNLKDKDGKKMSDNYLVKKIMEVDNHDWVKEIYYTGSGHIHFSNYVSSYTTKIETKKHRTILTTIGKHDLFVDNEEKIGAAIRMQQISLRIVAIIQLWIDYKVNLQKQPKT